MRMEFCNGIWKNQNYFSSWILSHIKSSGSDSKCSQWEFDFESGQPAKVQKNYKWEAVSSEDVPKMYQVNHIKRLYSVAENASFEGQLPKLRYYHHIKKLEPREENNNRMSVKNQPITANSKKNGSSGQLKITGEFSKKIFWPLKAFWWWHHFSSF